MVSTLSFCTIYSIHFQELSSLFPLIHWVWKVFLLIQFSLMTITICIPNGLWSSIRQLGKDQNYILWGTWLRKGKLSMRDIRSKLNHLIHPEKVLVTYLAKCSCAPMQSYTCQLKRPTELNGVYIQIHVYRIVTFIICEPESKMKILSTWSFARQ